MPRPVSDLPVSGAQDGKTYRFQVVVEPDGDAWSAYCPALLEKGASTWGATREEALRRIEEVARMVVASLIEHAEPVREEIRTDVQVRQDLHVAVTL